MNAGLRYGSEQVFHQNQRDRMPLEIDATTVSIVGSREVELLGLKRPSRTLVARNRALWKYFATPFHNRKSTLHP